MDTIDSGDSGRHPINIGQLVMGLAFLGLVVIWAVIQSDLVAGNDVRWLLPVPWVFAGAVGLLATTLAARRRGGENDWEGTWPGSSATGWVDTTPTGSTEPTGNTEPAASGPEADEER